LIDLLDDVETTSENGFVANILSEKFAASYPHIVISRPGRFLDTVRRLAAPTKPSAVGKQKLIGSPLTSYRHRQWIPRNRVCWHVYHMIACYGLHFKTAHSV
jgi:hypothetical protein